MPHFFPTYIFFCLIVLTSCSSFKFENRTADKRARNFSFSTDWFSGNIPVWQKHLREFKDRPNLRYLELGVYEGRSLVWMLENILTHPTARVVAIDMFPGDLLAKFHRNIAETGAQQKVEIIKGLFNETLVKQPKNSFDLIYLDGGHMSWTTLETTVLAWPLLKDNGILIFDDYRLHQDWPVEMTPKVAIDAFVLSHKYFVDVIEQNYQMFIRKVPNSCHFQDSYSCTPLASWSYYWNTKSLWDSVTKKEFKLSNARQAVVEELIGKYQSIVGTTRFQQAVVSDHVFLRLVSELQGLHNQPSKMPPSVSVPTASQSKTP